MSKSRMCDLVNPEGVVAAKATGVNPHPETLEGKTVLLRWNSKHNGDVFLSRIGELLVQKVSGVKIIKGWEVAHETTAISQGSEKSTELAKTIARFKPDLVIGSQGD